MTPPTPPQLQGMEQHCHHRESGITTDTSRVALCPDRSFTENKQTVLGKEGALGATETLLPEGYVMTRRSCPRLARSFLGFLYQGSLIGPAPRFKGSLQALLPCVSFASCCGKKSTCLAHRSWGIPCATHSSVTMCVFSPENWMRDSDQSVMIFSSTSL